MIRWMNERASGFGLLHHELDAHTLGMAQVADLLGRCGVRTSLADADSCADAARLVSGPAPGGLTGAIMNMNATACSAMANVLPAMRAQLIPSGGLSYL